MRDTRASGDLVHSKPESGFLSSDEFWSCHQAHLRKGNCCYYSMQPWKAHQVGPSFLILPFLVATNNSPFCGQNWASLKKKSLPMTCGEVEGGFFMPIKEVIPLPPCLVAWMPLQLFCPMENQKSKISTNTLRQQKSKECVFLVRMEDKREGSMF